MDHDKNGPSSIEYSCKVCETMVCSISLLHPSRSKTHPSPWRCILGSNSLRARAMTPLTCLPAENIQWRIPTGSQKEGRECSQGIYSLSFWGSQEAEGCNLCQASLDSSLSLWEEQHCVRHRVSNRCTVASFEIIHPPSAYSETFPT